MKLLRLDLIWRSFLVINNFLDITLDIGITSMHCQQLLICQKITDFGFITETSKVIVTCFQLKVMSGTLV
jgi:hypothetical protein